MADGESGENTQAQQGDQGQQGGTGQQQQGSGGSQGVTFTPEQQAHLNSLIANERRETERRIRESDELKDLRKKAKQFDEHEEASKTETQKLIDRAAKAEAERDGLAEKYRKALIQSAFTAAAIDKGLKGQPLMDALALADLSAVVLTDEGTVKGADKAIDAVLADRPYLLAGTQSGNGNGRSAPNINAGNHDKAPTKDELVKQAIEEGRRSPAYRGL